MKSFHFVYQYMTLSCISQKLNYHNIIKQQKPHISVNTRSFYRTEYSTVYMYIYQPWTKLYDIL